ncbi:MAG TPA: acyl-CoA carboxylase subunit beta [Candidatus Krumholzibacteria bacterium]|nr:acyl-CoA carboxylase subunit beta [Candidatus Krumholzibacteria bacterium]
MSEETIRDLHRRRAESYAGGGEKRIEKQHAAGKLTARERLSLLFDPDTFQEMNLHLRHRATNFGLDRKEFPGEGVVTGFGSVDDRPVYVASQDFTVGGGSVGEGTAHKIVEVMDAALQTGDPFLFINDGGGARIQEGVDALSGYGDIFYRNVLLSGVVPQISLIMGPCAGGAAYSPALTDFVIMVRGESQMFITGPKVIKEVTGEDIDAESLGGADAHGTHSGVAHFVVDSDEEGIALAKRLLTFLPSNNTEDPPFDPSSWDGEVVSDPELNEIVPTDPRQAYDIRDVIRRVIDNADFVEILEQFAPNIVTGLARIEGRVVGVIGNQPKVRAGVLDIDASSKGARFVRFCNAFNIPLVTFVDVPGFLPGVSQEQGGIIKHGSKMLFAYASATCPKLTVVLRKAYGGAYLAMCAKSMGADRICAWPAAEIAVMGAEGAVNILYRREINEAEDPVAERAKRIAEYRELFANPYVAAGRGLVDDVIEPADTRLYLATSLQVLRSKRELRPQKKHGLIQL